MVLSQEEIDQLAKTLIELRDSLASNPSPENKIKYQSYQNHCVRKLRFLVTHRAAKYKKFSNHADLEQDGFEALVLALKTYKPEKGAFSWWADKYISTRIARAANAHSTIRFPIQKAKELKPFKTNELPVMLDPDLDATSQMEKLELKKSIQTAISQLSPEQQQVISLIYGVNTISENSLDKVSQMLSLSRKQSAKLLTEAKGKLKEILCTE